jgi:hypothetical protein
MSALRRGELAVIQDGPEYATLAWSLQGPADPWCLGVNGLELVSSSHVARTKLSEAQPRRPACSARRAFGALTLFRPLAGPKTKA